MDSSAQLLSTISSSNIVELVRDRLTEAIITGALSPGERLVEAELARKMNISRGPIREAARLLEQQGLLESKPRRGFFVKEFGPEEIDNLFEMRTCLQVEAARLALKRAAPEDLIELRRRFKEVEERIDRREGVRRALDAGLHFHRLFFEMTRNPRFVRAFDDLATDTRHISAALNAYEETLTGETDTYFKHHLPPIVEAFEKGDPDLLVAAVRIYLADVRKSHAATYARMRADRMAGTAKGRRKPRHDKSELSTVD